MPSLEGSPSARLPAVRRRGMPSRLRAPSANKGGPASGSGRKTVIVGLDSGAVRRRKLTMKYAGRIVRHLGLQMYSGPVPAIAELIANAWDADASRVSVDIPLGRGIRGRDEITVSDDGEGMEWVDCNSKYMVIGRDAREEDGDLTAGRRKRMAHKGLGKLAGFGIATKVEVTTVRGGRRTRFVLDYSAIDKLDHGEEYVVDSESDAATGERNGTTVRLTGLTLDRQIPEKQFVASMSRRFSVVSDRFTITINGSQIKRNPGTFQLRFPDDRHHFEGEATRDGRAHTAVRGAGRIAYWIGLTEKPIKEPAMRGISVMSRGKMVQEPWFFEVTGGMYGQHGMQYMTGEIEADFLDEKTDYVTTNRGGVLWSQGRPAKLLEWGQHRVAEVLRRWAEERGRVRIEKIKRDAPFMDRIKKFPSRDRKEIQSVIHKMASIETIEDRRLNELARSFIDVYENRRLTDMIGRISSLEPHAQAMMYEILSDFQVVEAVSLAQIVQTRLKIISKFEEMIRKGAREVPDMQRHLKNHPWLISPSYAGLVHEQTLDKTLREKFGAGSKARAGKMRPDFFCMGELGRAFVIEIKRPGVTIGRKGIRQLEDYIDFFTNENAKTTKKEDKKTFFGYLIGSKFADDTEGLRDRAAAAGITVTTWDALLRTAKNEHKDFYSAMKKRAPGDDPRMADLDSADQG